MNTAPASGPSQTGHSSWLPLIGWFFCSIFFFYAFVHRVAPSVMVDDLMRDFQVSGAVLGNLSAIYFYAYAGLQIPVGVALDRYSPRYIITTAAAICALGGLIFATADSLWMAYLGRLLVGAGAAFSFAGALVIAGQWYPPHRFGVFGGFAQMFGAMGGIAGQAPLSAAIEAYGWRDAGIGVAIGGAVLAVALFLSLRDRPAAMSAEKPPMFRALMRTMRNPQTWLPAFVGGTMTGSLLSFAGLWGVPFLVEVRGIANTEAAAIISTVFIGWVIGAPVYGILSDRLRRRRIFVLMGTLFSGVFMGAVVLWPTMPTWMLVAVMFTQGIGASSMVLCFALARENNPAWASGATIGVINSFVVGSGAILQPILGWMLDARWDGALRDNARIYSVEAYAEVLPILPATCFLGTALVFLVKESWGRHQVED